jgi:hypothetical protein
MVIQEIHVVFQATLHPKKEDLRLEPMDPSFM